MSRYSLRGRVGLCDEPDPYSTAYEPSSLSTDFRWEVGYEADRVTYFAVLYDDVPDDDPDYPGPPGAPRVMKVIGWSHGIDSVEGPRPRWRSTSPSAWLRPSTMSESGISLAS